MQPSLTDPIKEIPSQRHVPPLVSEGLGLSNPSAGLTGLCQGGPPGVLGQGQLECMRVLADTPQLSRLCPGHRPLQTAEGCLPSSPISSFQLPSLDSRDEGVITPPVDLETLGQGGPPAALAHSTC